MNSFNERYIYIYLIFLVLHIVFIVFEEVLLLLMRHFFIYIFPAAWGGLVIKQKVHTTRVFVYLKQKKEEGISSMWKSSVCYLKNVVILPWTCCLQGFWMTTKHFFFEKVCIYYRYYPKKKQLVYRFNSCWWCAILKKFFLFFFFLVLLPLFLFNIFLVARYFEAVQRKNVI